jgi:dienelactone hydrolase
MGELNIPELLACLFLFLPLIRPFIKQLWPMEGLVWLPPLALGIIIALFPAYGFRPECLPLLLLALVVNCANLPSLGALLSHLRNDDFRERNPLLVVLALILLAGAAGIALYFRPAPGPALLSRGVGAFSLEDEARGVRLTVRIYGPEDGGAIPPGEPRPVMVMVPPAAGSVGSIDRVCGELRDLGFTVISYSRGGFDFPAIGEDGRKIQPPADQILRLLRVMSRGHVSAAVNAQGRLMEDQRRQDTAFLLARVGESVPSRDAFPPGALAGADRKRVFLVGYGAGGAAVLLLAGAPDFASRYPGVRGLIAVESPVLSALRGDEREEPPPLGEDAGWFRAIGFGISNWARGLKPQRITGMTAVPAPAVPLLLLVSDRALQDRYVERRYGTLWRLFDDAKKPAILAAVPGAGPLDYSDIPLKYPLYAALFPGAGAPLWSNGEIPRNTAALMANFAALLRQAVPPAPPSLAPGVYIETREF